jgi:hypothetical protein
MSNLIKKFKKSGAYIMQNYSSNKRKGEEGVRENSETEHAFTDFFRPAFSGLSSS